MTTHVYKGLGLMSGSSLDGLDIAFCEFANRDGAWTYTIHQAKTYPYDQAWKDRLQQAYTASAEEYFKLHALYGQYTAQRIRAFLLDATVTPDFIASHGHTVFHRPAQGFSTQIGCGATIAAQTGITTVCDFRSLDVAHGGQGAPLVPVGDQLLFGNYSSCLNIGGIANVSYETAGERRAYDICFANMAFNYFSRRKGLEYDLNGQLAAAGHVDIELLERLNVMARHLGKVSLGREQFEQLFLKAIGDHSSPVEDLLATCVEHTAMQIAAVLHEQHLPDVLVTGGGAYHKHLMNRLKALYEGKVVVPDDHTIQFKEALIFAFLGMLRLQNRTNTLKSVTGASQDSVGGAVYNGH